MNIPRMMAPEKTRTCVLGWHSTSVGVAPAVRDSPPTVLLTVGVGDDHHRVRLDYDQAIELAHSIMGAAAVIRAGNELFWAEEEAQDDDDEMEEV